MTFCAGGIVLESTQKPGGNPAGKGGGAGAGGAGGAGGVGGGAGAVGGAGAGDVVGGVPGDTAANGSVAPDPHPNRKNPGMSKNEVATLAKIFIPIPVVSRVNAEECNSHRLKLRQLDGSQYSSVLRGPKPVLALKACQPT